MVHGDELERLVSSAHFDILSFFSDGRTYTRPTDPLRARPSSSANLKTLARHFFLPCSRHRKGERGGRGGGGNSSPFLSFLCSIDVFAFPKAEREIHPIGPALALPSLDLCSIPRCLLGSVGRVLPCRVFRTQGKNISACSGDREKTPTWAGRCVS